MSHASTSRLPEFQAVILCGHGEDLYPLTAASGSSGLPKALLPVANKPLVEGVLKWIEQAGLSDILLLAPESQQGDISSYLRSRRQHNSDLRIDLECFDDEERWETAEVLKWAANKYYIKTDFVLLPCDLCIVKNAESSDFNLSHLLDRHRLGENLMTSLLVERTAGNEEKPKDGPPAMLSIIDPVESLLLDIKDMDDFDDEVDLRSSLVSKYPKTMLAINLLPAHVYVCSERIITILNAIPALKSFKNDVMPFLCKTQWQDNLLSINSDDNKTDAKPNPQSLALAHSSTVIPRAPATSSATTAKLSSSARPPLRSLSTSFWESSVSLKRPLDDRRWLSDVRCAVAIWRKSDGFCARANTVEAYTEVNRLVLPLAAAQAAADRPQATSGGPRQLGVDCIVGSGLSLGDKVIVKKCSVGKNVTIQTGARANGCVLMDGVIIGEGAKLEGCIVGPNARIGSNAILNKCYVAAKCEVSEGAVSKGENLVELQ